MFGTIITIGVGVIAGLWLQHKKILTFPAVETFCDKTKEACKEVVEELTPKQAEETPPVVTTIDDKNDAHKN